MKQRLIAYLQRHRRSISYSIGIVGILGMCTILFFSFKPQQTNPQKFTVTLTGQEWQTIINAVTNPDDFSNNQKKQVSELITKNIVAVDTTKKK
jgi:hypothetical protein